MLTGFYLKCTVNNAKAIISEADYLRLLVERMGKGEEIKGENILLALDVIKTTAETIEGDAKAVIQSNGFNVEDLNLAISILERVGDELKNERDDNEPSEPIQGIPMFPSAEIAF